MEPSQGKKLYEEKKVLRQQGRDVQSKGEKQKHTTAKVVRIIVSLLIIAGIIYGVVLLSKARAPKTEDRSKAHNIQSRGHVPVGTTGFAYNSNPPSSGEHYPTTARLGFYDVDEPVADGHIIHNLEHGQIWIAYSTEVSEEVRKQLKKLAKGKVIVVPREANEYDISVVAWGRVDSFNISDGELDSERIRDFVKRYQNKGPEQNIPGARR